MTPIRTGSIRKTSAGQDMQSGGSAKARPSVRYISSGVSLVKGSLKFTKSPDDCAVGTSMGVYPQSGPGCRSHAGAKARDAQGTSPCANVPGLLCSASRSVAGGGCAHSLSEKVARPLDYPGKLKPCSDRRSVFFESASHFTQSATVIRVGRPRRCPSSASGGKLRPACCSRSGRLNKARVGP